MNVKKLVKVGLLTVCLTLAVAAAAFAAFGDMQGHWANPVVTKWESLNLVAGYPDGDFKPDQIVTRAEFAALVNRIAGYPAFESVVDKYVDVTGEDWFAADVATAVGQGYMTGYDATTFGPNDPVTREQAAVIIALIKGLSVNEARAYAFNDGEAISSWALGYVGAVAEAGYMIGDDENMFHPMQGLTRAEAVSALDRVFAIEAPPQGGEPSGEPAPSEPTTPVASGSEELNVTLAGENGSVGVSQVKTVNYDLKGDATVTAASSDEAIATVEVDNGKIKITGVKQGTATITVTATAEDGTTATDTYDITVSSNISVSSGGGGGGSKSYTIVLPAGTKVKVDGTPAGPIDFELAKDLENTTKLDSEYELTVDKLMAAVDPDSDAYAKLQKAAEVKGGSYVLISGTVESVKDGKVAEATWNAKDGMTVVNGDEVKDALQVK